MIKYIYTYDIIKIISSYFKIDFIDCKCVSVIIWHHLHLHLHPEMRQKRRFLFILVSGTNKRLLLRRKRRLLFWGLVWRTTDLNIIRRSKMIPTNVSSSFCVKHPRAKQEEQLQMEGGGSETVPSVWSESSSEETSGTSDGSTDELKQLLVWTFLKVGAEILQMFVQLTWKRRNV